MDDKTLRRIYRSSPRINNRDKTTRQDQEARIFGLKINIDKTREMRINARNQDAIKLRGQDIEDVEQFSEEIKCRIRKIIGHIMQDKNTDCNIAFNMCHGGVTENVKTKNDVETNGGEKKGCSSLEIQLLLHCILK